MKEILSAISKYKFGGKFRTFLLIGAVILIVFHAFVLLAPFIPFEHLRIGISDKHLEHFRKISDSISNITLAFILILIIAEGQKSIRDTISRQRRQTYAQTEQQILDWFKVTKPQAFDVDANLINSEPAVHQSVLRNFKVEGSPRKLAELAGVDSGARELVEKYCKNVHFEITCYPSEIIYGIHIEFDDYETSRAICDELLQLLAINRQSKEFAIDDTIPKKPGWIFVTKTVQLEGDEDKDFPKTLTHARHFVELVGHNFDYVYSKPLLDAYLNRVAGT